MSTMPKCKRTIQPAVEAFRGLVPQGWSMHGYLRLQSGDGEVVKAQIIGENLTLCRPLRADAHYPLQKLQACVNYTTNANAAGVTRKADALVKGFPLFEGCSGTLQLTWTLWFKSSADEERTRRCGKTRVCIGEADRPTFSPVEAALVLHDFAALILRDSAAAKPARKTGRVAGLHKNCGDAGASPW